DQSVFGTFDASGNLTAIPVLFHYSTGVANGYDTLRLSNPGDTISATLKLSAVVDTKATEDNNGNIQQYLRLVSLSFVADTPLNGASNLLTVTPNTLGYIAGAEAKNTQGAANVTYS